MCRSLCHLTLVALLTLIASLVAPSAGAAGLHPLVGAWVLDLDVHSLDDPPLYLLVHDDGTWQIANPYYGDGVGAWQPIGDRMADGTIVFQDIDPDPNVVVTGTIVARLAMTVDPAGNGFDVRWSSEKRWPDGTLASVDDGAGRGDRAVLQAGGVASPEPNAAGAPVSQPGPPATGPGSEQTAFPAARATRYGSEPGGFWLWEPTSGADAAPALGPLPVVLYVDGCCTGDVPNLGPDAPLPVHLARQGYVVIAPIYRDTKVLDDVPVIVRDALAELARPGHGAVDVDRFVVVGYSFGGVPAVTYAASAAALGLPVPRALYVLAPCVDGGRTLGADPASTCRELPQNPVFPGEMKAAVLAFGEDLEVGIDMPRAVFGALSSLPSGDRTFAVMPSDGHGDPPLIARHETPVDGVDAADWFGVWRLADALFACALTGQWCDQALGDTPGQRAMGVWSDGVPIAELTVGDAPNQG